MHNEANDAQQFASMKVDWWDPKADSRLEERAPIFSMQYDAVSDFIDYVKLPHQSRALDVACGRGRYTELLEQKGFVTNAVDISLPMINIAKTHVKSSMFVNADVLSLPIASDSISLVTAIDITMHVPKINELLSEMQRIIAPGGYLIISFTNKRGLYSTFRRRFFSSYPRIHYTIREAETLIDHSGLKQRQRRGLGTVNPFSLRPDWQWTVVDGHTAAVASRFLDPYVGDSLGNHQIILCQKIHY